jgi:gas vesicle protein
MFIKLNQKRGQNTAEYAILIGVIVAAAIAMQIYIRRGMQARLKDAVDFTQTADDDAGNSFFNSAVKQYEPYYLESNFQTTQEGKTTEELQVGGGVVRNSLGDATSRTGNQIYSNYAAANV